MDMNWLQSFLYGIVSGLSEFIPVSSRTHQSILLELFGQDSRDPILDALVHIAVLLSVFSACRNLIEYLQREKKISMRRLSTRNKSYRGNLDMRFIKTASGPLLVGFVVLTYIGSDEYSFASMALLLLINGIILFIPGRLFQGNKDARSMSALDSVMTGILGALSAFPGISRMACTASFTIARGADRQHALNWALLLSIPALALLTVLDILALFTAAQAIKLTAILGYILAVIGAYLGGYFGIIIMKFLSVRTGFTGFAYYCWGASLFALILYLI